MKKKIIVFSLVVCLICVHLLGTVAKAEDTTPQYYYVTTSRELRDVLQEVKDGDIIRVYGQVEVMVDVNIGNVSLVREDANSTLKFSSVTATNTTFDGQNYKSTDSWVTIVGQGTFENCTFQNSGVDYIAGTGAFGGAVQVQYGSVAFNDCLFKNNHGLIGGHLAIFNDSIVELNDCTLTGGTASSGGAVAVSSISASCTVEGGTITDNKAYDYGGGIANGGILTVSGTKIYANSAVNGGADVATKVSGNTTLTDSVEQLNELFSNDKIEVSGWVNDYDRENGIYIPDVDTSQESALLKLQYQVIPEPTTEPTTEPITEQTTEPSSEATTEPTTEPRTEKPTESSESESSTEQTAEQPKTDTEKESSTATPSDASTPSNTSSTVDNSSSTSSTISDSSTSTTDNSQHNSSVSSSDNHTSSSTTTNSNSTVDNSDRSHTTENNDSSNRSVTTYNYYTTQTQPQPSTPVQQSGKETIVVVQGQGTIPQEQTTPAMKHLDDVEQTGNVAPTPNINIDAKGVDCVIKYNESGGYDISISSSQVTEVKDTDNDSWDWLDVVQVALLGAIFLCLIWQPKSKKE